MIAVPSELSYWVVMFFVSIICTLDHPVNELAGSGVIQSRLFFLVNFSSGVKFIIVADTRQQKVEDLLKKIYENYSDYVLKNPFYSLDMPIR